MRPPPKRELYTFQGHGSEQKGLGPGPRLPGDHVPLAPARSDTHRCIRVNAHTTYADARIDTHVCRHTCSQVHLRTRHADTAVHVQVGACTRRCGDTRYTHTDTHV